MDEEFETECLKEKQITKKPGAVEIKEARDKELRYKSLLANSDYFLEGAKLILGTNVAYLAITLGFFAMEHAANALIAKQGYLIKNHECTQMFLSKLLNRKDLAADLSKAYQMRIAFNYRFNLEEKEDKSDAERFVNEAVVPFIQEIDKLFEKGESKED